MSKLYLKIFRARKYFRYWLDSLDEHSLHSPFIFGFFNEVIKSKKEVSDQFKGIENLRDILLRDDRVIDIQDLGAGSSVNQELKRQVKDIAFNSLNSKKDAQLFYRIIDFLNAKNILELGTSLGINCLYLASHPGVKKVITVEGCKNTSDIAKSTFQGLLEDKITLITSDIAKAFPDISYHANRLDFIVMDANHTFEATIEYYKSCKRYLHEDSVIVIDDIYWSEGMAQAWEEIKNDIVVTLSIDLYKMGIVFFKKNLQKEHYVLKY